MRIGTRTVLFGYHQFLVHPWFVALGWWKLFGFPWDPRLWLCFFVHDLGYLGKPNLDGPEGEAHVLLGARIMRPFGRQWANECEFHSRFWARRADRRVSRLCLADKQAFLFTPRWLWWLQVRASGEWREYIASAKYIENVAGYSRKTLNDKYDAVVVRLTEFIDEELSRL